MRESLQLLAEAAPAGRWRLRAVTRGILRAWRLHWEDLANPVAMPGDASASGSGRAVPGPAEALPFSWAIATLACMAEDDPLWSCKLALLRSSIPADGLAPQAAGVGPHPAPRPGERPAFLPALDALPLPFGGAARAFRVRLDHQLRSGASSAISESLFAANFLLSPAERPAACWIPCLLGLAGLQDAGWSEPGAAQLLDFINENARQQLSKLPPGSACTWLVGRDPYERCAARLLALLFLRRGRTCFPWTSAAPPRSGRYLQAGIGAGIAADELPGNCQGTADLLEESLQNHALARATSRWGGCRSGTALAAAGPPAIPDDEAVGPAPIPATGT